MKISDIYREQRGDELFHYTHSSNVENLRKHGFIYSTKELDEKEIDRVNITNDLSLTLDSASNLNDYVFLTFSTKHPFIYKLRKSKVDLVVITLDVSILDIDGVLVSDRVANSRGALFYTPEEALKRLLIKFTDGKPLADETIWRKVIKYEILVPKHIDIRKYMRIK